MKKRIKVGDSWHKIDAKHLHARNLGDLCAGGMYLGCDQDSNYYEVEPAGLSVDITACATLKPTVFDQILPFLVIVPVRPGTDNSGFVINIPSQRMPHVDWLGEIPDNLDNTSYELDMHGSTATCTQAAVEIAIDRIKNYGPVSGLPTLQDFRLWTTNQANELIEANPKHFYKKDPQSGGLPGEKKDMS